MNSKILKLDAPYNIIYAGGKIGRHIATLMMWEDDAEGGAEVFEAHQYPIIDQGNESYEQLSYRAVEIAFRKSIILYVMNGNKWSKEIEDLVTYLFDYDMWVKMCLFGEEITNKLAKDNRVMKPGVPCLLEQLNDTFTRQEFEILYKAQNTVIGNVSKAASNLLSQWKKRGWIEETGEKGIYCKTEAYYRKHTA